MSDGIVAQGTKLEMGTGAGGAVTITVMTLSNPTILTAVAHGLSNGTIVTLANFAGDDAADINGEICVVKNVTDDTFAVDVDTTGKTITDNTDAATATPVTYTEIKNILNFDVVGDKHNMIDFTNLVSTRSVEKPGIPRGSEMTFPLNWTSDDPGLLAAEIARAAGTEKDWKITYSDSSVHSFKGYVINIQGGSGGVDEKVDGSITIHRSGALTLT